MAGSPFLRYLAGGTKRTEAGFYDTNGFMCGAAGVLANGADSPMMRLWAIKNIDVTIPERVRETQTGDDEVQGSLYFGPTDPVVLNIQTGLSDLDVEAAMQDINVYNDTQKKLIVLNPNVDSFPLACMLTMGIAKKKVFGEAAVKGYEVNVFNSGEFVILGRDALAERTLGNYDLTMTCDQTSTFPWGEAMSIANHGTLGGAGGKWPSENKLTMHAFRGDGTDVTLTLAETPAGDDTSGRIKVYKETSAHVRSVLTPTSGYTVVTSTKVLTFAVAPAAGDHIIVLYEYV